MNIRRIIERALASARNLVVTTTKHNEGWGRYSVAIEAKPKPLFEPGLRYPCDEIGTYTELAGEVTKVCPFLDEACAVTVQTAHGDIEGWTRNLRHLPKVGYQATIRVYRSGGGFYPDNRIVGWTSTAFSMGAAVPPTTCAECSPTCPHGGGAERQGPPV